MRKQLCKEEKVSWSFRYQGLNLYGILNPCDKTADLLYDLCVLMNWLTYLLSSVEQIRVRYDTKKLNCPPSQ